MGCSPGGMEGWLGGFILQKGTLKAAEQDGGSASIPVCAGGTAGPRVRWLRLARAGVYWCILILFLASVILIRFSLTSNSSFCRTQRGIGFVPFVIGSKGLR